MGINGVIEKDFQKSMIRNAGNIGNNRNYINGGMDFARQMTETEKKPELYQNSRNTRSVTVSRTAMDAYMVLSASGTRAAGQNKPKPEYETYESENYKIVPDNESECFTIYNKQGERIGAFEYSDIKIRQDAATGCQFLISKHGTMSYDAVALDNELREDLQKVMGMDTLEVEALHGYTLKTHAGTGIQYLLRDGEEGRGGKVLLQSEEDVRKYEALAETYFNKYSNLVKDKNAAYIYADLEIKGLAQHTKNGIITMGYDGISYHDNLERNKNWSILFSGDTYQRISTWMQGNRGNETDMQKISTWLNILKKQ